MISRSPRIVRVLIVACVLALALAGCVGIPSSGGVNQGPLVTSAGDSPFVTDPVGSPAKCG